MSLISKRQDIQKLFWLRATLLCAFIFVVFLLLGNAQAEQNAPEDDTNGEVIFVPPASGAPSDRLGAGTRDVEVSSAATILLAPSQGGVSSGPKPLLVWYFSEPVEGPVTVTLRPMSGLARGFVATLQGRFKPGFHGLDLGRSQIELKPDTLYRWEVREADNAQNASPALIEYRETKTPPRSANSAAAAGIWYDAVAFLFESDFSGRIKVKDIEGLQSLTKSAGLDLTKILEAQQ